MTRADRLTALLQDAGCDLLLVSAPANVRWLTGFTGSSGAAVVGASGERRFYTDFRYATVIEEQVDPAWERIISNELVPSVADDLRALGARRVGFDDGHVTVRAREQFADGLGAGIDLVAAGGLVERLRAVKDRAEQERMRAAALLADAAFTIEILERGIVGRTEEAVALDLETRMRTMGAQAASFPPIVAAAGHGALPHAEPRDLPIPPDTLVVIDWGAQLDGYCSDCTRTVATGTVPDAMREGYDLVLRAELAALEAVRPGRSGREVDAVARDLIAAAGKGDLFGHGLGHGVGLEIHEAPRLSRAAPDDPLLAGMVVTIEPGIYVPGEYGVRIEDLVVVADDGPEALNALPKEFTEVA